jgi:hypothetical protein
MKTLNTPDAWQAGWSRREKRGECGGVKRLGMEKGGRRDKRIF